MPNNEPAEPTSPKCDRADNGGLSAYTSGGPCLLGIYASSKRPRPCLAKGETPILTFHCRGVQHWPLHTTGFVGQVPVHLPECDEVPPCPTLGQRPATRADLRKRGVLLPNATSSGLHRLYKISLLDYTVVWAAHHKGAPIGRSSGPHVESNSTGPSQLIPRRSPDHGGRNYDEAETKAEHIDPALSGGGLVLRRRSPSGARPDHAGRLEVMATWQALTADYSHHRIVHTLRH